MTDLEMTRKCAELCDVGPRVWAPQFNPLNDNADAFTVLAKLWLAGKLERNVVGALYYTLFDPVTYFVSETVVTDESTLRRAIVETGAQVGEAG